MGNKMKELKAEPPASQIILLGVDWEIKKNLIRASPCKGDQNHTEQYTGCAGGSPVPDSSSQAIA